MNSCCTFPGRIGDCFWALPTVRAIAESYDTPVHLRMCTSPKDFSTVLPLIRQQPYIASAEVLADWQPREDGPYPFTPRAPERIDIEADRIIHLGYEGWPSLDLPNDVRRIAETQITLTRGTWRLDPWITTNASRPSRMLPMDLVLGFTDEHFELKYGLYRLLDDQLARSGPCCVWPLFAEGSRWATEGCDDDVGPTTWLEAAALIRDARATLACCSAIHVLSCAMGKHTVTVEPNAARHNPIFWPEAVRDRVHPVIGGDGKLTHDARHVWSAIRQFA